MARNLIKMKVISEPNLDEGSIIKLTGISDNGQILNVYGYNCTGISGSLNKEAFVILSNITVTWRDDTGFIKMNKNTKVCDRWFIVKYLLYFYKQLAQSH